MTKKMSRRRALLCGAIASLAVLLWAAAPALAGSPNCGKAAQAPRLASEHELRTAVLCLVNQARVRHGIEPLAFNEALRDSASAHSKSMVRSGSLSHYGPHGSTPTTRIAHSGYLGRTAYYRLAENIATGFGRSRGSPLAIVDSWLHSPEHRRNILDSGLHDFGVGVARGDTLGNHDNAATYTLDFGARG